MKFIILSCPVDSSRAIYSPKHFFPLKSLQYLFSPYLGVGDTSRNRILYHSFAYFTL
jgi:hypothetical protein